MRAVLRSRVRPEASTPRAALALNNTFYHWGALIVGPGYADPIQFQSGNPYGVSFQSNNGALSPDEVALSAARFQGRRVAELAAQFTAGRK
jgi:NAD(P)H dehydrogenase (quinone)